MNKEQKAELKEELVEHLTEFIAGHTDIYACDIVTKLFESPYLIYYSHCDKWLEKYGSHKQIGREVTKLDLLHFNKAQIDYFDSEQLVHQYAMYNCHQIISESITATENWNSRLSDSDRDELIYELNNMI